MSRAARGAALTIAFILGANSSSAEDGCTLLGEKIFGAMAEWRAKPDDPAVLRTTRDRILNSLNTQVGLLLCGTGGTGLKASPDLVKKYIASEAGRKMVDKQTGSGAGSSGSTTAIAGASVPQFLAFAVESGAVTQKVDGTAVTVRVNPVKLANALRSGTGEMPLPPDDPGYRALSRLNLAFTMDRSRTPSATTTDGLTLTERFKQVTDVSLRIDLRNDQDPFSRRALEKVETLTASLANGPLHRALEALAAKQRINQAVRDARVELMQRLMQNPAVDKAEVISILTAGIEAINVKFFQGLDITQELNAMGVALMDFKAKQSQIADEIAHGFVATMDFNWKRPPLTTVSEAASAPTPSGKVDGNFRPSATTTQLTTTSSAQAPNLYTAQLILSGRLIGKSQGTATFGASFFERKMTGMKDVWRDASAGAKWSIPMGTVKSGKTSLHFSGLYQHLHQKPLGIDLVINTVTVNKPGNIGLFQAQYRIDMGTSGISIPLSFTASNRTELVKEKELRGNIGISFDLSKLWP